MFDAENLPAALAREAARLRGGRRCGRYAPSPTGALHLGNVRTALVAWLHARLDDAVFCLRMEDLDRPRARPGSARLILEDLAWLGLDWDEGPDRGGPLGPYVQSARHSLYEATLERLRAEGLVYACYCSRRDIAEAASAPHGDTPVYPGTCRELDATERERAAARIAPRAAAWRFRTDVSQAGSIRMDDAVYGRVEQDLGADVGDFVVRRSDRLFAYQLAVVVDDALMGVTDVVRGEDLLDSTPRQLALIRALGLPEPRHLHVPLVYDRDGRRLAKRDGTDSLLAARERGARPQQVVATLARSLGLADAPEVDARELLKSLDSARLVEALATLARRSPEAGTVELKER